MSAHRFDLLLLDVELSDERLRAFLSGSSGGCSALFEALYGPLRDALEVELRRRERGEKTTAQKALERTYGPADPGVDSHDRLPGQP